MECSNAVTQDRRTDAACTLQPEYALHPLHTPYVRLEAGSQLWVLHYRGYGPTVALCSRRRLDDRLDDFSITPGMPGAKTRNRRSLVHAPCVAGLRLGAFILPAENEQDVRFLPDYMRNKVKLLYVRDIQEALNGALMPDAF